MPCLNEAETLETCIRKARDFLERHGVRGEIVIGDNGSTDGSQEIARRCGARVVDVKVRGYGAALYHATLAARGKYVIMGDSDDSYDFSDLMPLLKELRAGRDLVMGNRFPGGIKPGAMPWKNRYLGNPILSGLGRLFFKCPVRDFHCGLRGYSAEAFRRMDLQTTGMEFASEMVIKATLLGMDVAEAPTTLSPDGRSRPPHLRPWRDGWRHLRFMLLYSPRWLFLYPGLLLMLLGLGVGAWLLPQPRQVGGTVLDVHTLLYAAAAVLLGFQTCMFAVLARAFAASRKLLPERPLLTWITAPFHFGGRPDRRTAADPWRTGRIGRGRLVVGGAGVRPAGPERDAAHRHPVGAGPAGRVGGRAVQLPARRAAAADASKGRRMKAEQPRARLSEFILHPSSFILPKRIPPS